MKALVPAGQALFYGGVPAVVRLPLEEMCMSIVETRKWVHSMALALVTLGLTTSLALAYALPAAAEAGRVAPAARPVVPISRTDPATRDARVERALARMTLPEKIGQMLLIGTHHKELRPSMERLLQRYHFGALIYFDWNMDSPAQVARYSAQLQGARGSRLPLFIAIDEEGGRVARMKHALPAPPSQQQLGRTGRPELAEQSAFDISGKLLAMGINLNFAPVADVGTGNTRYFSADPQQAADFVQAAARGYSRAGMLYTLKHFPGLGRGVVDTHVAGSRVPATRAELDACDLVPFQRMIATGADDCLIMVSHLTTWAWAPSPATTKLATPPYRRCRRARTSCSRSRNTPTWCARMKRCWTLCAPAS